MTPDASSILAYRFAVQHIGSARIPPDRIADAARPGLQDGSPRSGLLSLHARVDAVTPDSWEHDDLAQVFFRASVYLVPRRDVGVFTRGAFPVDEERAAEVTAHAEKIASTLGSRTSRQADVERALPHIDRRAFRRAFTTGRFAIRWDARDITISVSDPPVIPVDRARRELARRFFFFLGPASVEDFQWWIDATVAEAHEIVAAIEGELTEIETPHGPMLVSSESSGMLESPAPPPNVVLLPADDPAFLRRVTSRWLDPNIARFVWPKAPPPGIAVVNGAIAGRWRRRSNRTTIEVFEPQPTQVVDAMTRLASSFPIEADVPAEVEVVGL